MTTDTLVYTTTTGQAHGTMVGPEFLGMPEVRVEVWDDFCFICGRCTDHSGEHDEARDEHEVQQAGHVTYYITRVFPL